MSAGNGYTCAIREDASLSCWGYGVYLAYHEWFDRDARFAAFAAASDYACGILVDGSILCVGPIADPPAGIFERISAGPQHACAVRADGNLLCWGNGTEGKTKPPAGDFRSVAVGNNHACAIRTDGSVACWGNNDKGQGSAPAGQFDQITAGKAFTCGIRPSGSVECWGSNTDNRATPPAESFRQIEAGETHTCGVRSDGTLACWGSNFEELSLPPGQFSNVTSGSTHSCAIRDDGDVLCWNESGSTNATTSPPPLVADITMIGGGGGSEPSGLCALEAGGAVTCWRDTGVYPSTYYERRASAKYVQVSAAHDYGDIICGVTDAGAIDCWGYLSYNFQAPTGLFSSVSVGTGWFSCGIRQDGTLRCWKHEFPAPSPPNGTFSQLSVGRGHACAIGTAGSLACWGSESYGEVIVPPAGAFTSLDSSYSNCAVRTDGTVHCWPGDHEVVLDAKARSVSIGDAGQWGCSVLEDDTIQCWALAEQEYLTAIVNGAPRRGSYVRVTTEDLAACALSSHGAVTCWGEYRNVSPMLSNGVFVASRGMCSASSCGDGVAEGFEACDDGDASFAVGDYCSATCSVVRCATPTRPGASEPVASDALFTLRAAVGASNCDVRVCDVNADFVVTAADALRILRRAVGGTDPLLCPATETPGT